MKKLAAVTLSLFLATGSAAFADSPKDTPKEADAQPAKTAPAAKPATTKSNAEIAAEMEELRQALQAQQEQLQMLKEELAKRDKEIEEAKEAAASANSRASEANVKATEAVTASAEVKSTTSALNTTVASMAAAQPPVNASLGTPADPQGGAEDKGPTTIRFKGINITPGGFLAAETVYRNRATSGDIATPFTSIPFTSAGLAHVSENNFSGRQSRLSLLLQSKFSSVNVEGYYEADFLGAGTTSNDRQTNSYVFRQRQVYAQAALENGWKFTGGQMWSLAMENRKGIANRGENTPIMIDPNYVVGMTWERQYAFRVVKSFGDKFALGMSVEGPQTTIGGRGFSSVTTINSAAAPTTVLTSSAGTNTSAVTTTQSGNFFLNAPGSGAGLYNGFDATGYTVNKAPDLIFKAAFDPGFGHYEILGIVSFMRDRIYPCGVVGTTAGDTVKGTTSFTGACTSPEPTVVSSFGAYNSGATGGGFGASAMLPIAHKVDIGVKAVGGNGIARYGAAQLADATARPDGTLALIRTAHGLARLEWHPVPKFDLYAYWGMEYAWRAGYEGYTAITVTQTAAIPGTTSATGVTTLPIPATKTTKITTGGIGGYGNVAANNSGCATEGVPVNDFNPSLGTTNCAGDIRIIKETTVGFWHKIYQGEKGRVQWGMQYSYLVKNAWSGTGGPAGSNYGPKANDNMFWTSFRYYLP